MAGPDGQTDWMIWNWAPQWTWDKALQDFHTNLTLSASHILISRQMPEEGFIKQWQQTAESDDEQAAFARHIAETLKTVILVIRFFYFYLLMSVRAKNVQIPFPVKMKFHLSVGRYRNRQKNIL